MNLRQTGLLFLLGCLIALAMLWASLTAPIRAQEATPPPAPTPGPTASPAELAQAMQEWGLSAHADTYDDGMGANTTCARCKAPQNWDPYNLALAESLDCASCKRVPGAPRPDLASGVTIPQADWLHIGCEICHQPVGDSFSTSLAFWNQALGRYEAVASSSELCARCHEGQHGFDVTHEQEVSPAHQGWECTRCHGSHGSPVLCTDCHDPNQGSGAAEHARHPNVDCTACHDAGGLSIWLETNPDSPHYNLYIPLRFAHALTSWPSHNLRLSVRCERCHHPPTKQQAPLVESVGCDACHEGGAVLFWCDFFPRDADPHPAPVDGQ